MPHRKLRVVRLTPIALALCEHCYGQFTLGSAYRRKLRQNSSSSLTFTSASVMKSMNLMLWNRAWDWKLADEERSFGHCNVLFVHASPHDELRLNMRSQRAENALPS